ncbi:probable FBD-associated F-box protein At1g32375 [Aegilops tauschii subsp. strangulata]|uniref:probable FBD-associated F-box protein At1g32375 n=1 Tax=Aegilops tauschii subsp. strangulata TaxID=200361 RepID=UPI00098BCE6B|nr:FBD-associated F-box protein At5g56380-like [Aegilops tauschii subsp. strangulata]
MEKEEAAAARPARNEQESHGTAWKRARSGDCDVNSGDLISHLADALLGTIISLLPTKDGGRTQILSRRWRHLWRSAPLSLEVLAFLPVPVFDRYAVPTTAVSKIISQHPGPARRFSFLFLGAGDLYAEVESWFDSRALANLQELDIGYEYLLASKGKYQLPQSTFRSASTLLVAKIRNCGFSDTVPLSFNFPLLKELSLHYVSFSGAFQSLLSGCHALESLYMLQVHATAGCLRVCSPTLRSIGFRDNSGEKTELVLEDAPRLERLLLPYCHRNDCVTIRVIRAPKLKILGPFSADSCKFRIFQGMSPVSSANSIHTVKVLALTCSSLQLDAVLGVLRWFPCLEKLYVSFHEYYQTHKKFEPQGDPLYPIECLQTHLKKVMLTLYMSYEKQVHLARFFVLNAKVLKKIEFLVWNDYSDELVAHQHSLLQVKNRASRDAQFEFRNSLFFIDKHVEDHIHDLSVADPFRQP